MVKFHKICEEVGHILKNDQSSRSSDTRLWLLVASKYNYLNQKLFKDKHGRTSVALEDLSQCPLSLESVSRQRRKYQELGKYMGDLASQKARKQLRRDYKNEFTPTNNPNL